ncbi:nucleoside/nucleotide kinase family protein [Xenophilus azovorans]|uniref:nucleoside/nucleotide kinase family protein n=1 Tax=Xenophilus azovorans TaxID=151755 RepID=UPI000571F73F|nr:nucleoside/nucleotide kinase family protein [Xenophilus azovorans]
MADATPALPADTLRRLDGLMAAGRRFLLGLAGPPGAGKSTLAEALAAHCGARAVVVPMDGFHLAQAELQRLGRAGRKGAPDTFDAAGYAALLARLRAQRPGDPAVYAPAFRREIEEPVAGAIAVEAHVPLVITEGNYLLLDEGGWAGVRPLLDACWWVEVDDALRRERLVERHRRFGRSTEAARRWVETTDEPNAQRIAAGRARADHVFRWPG